jgi:HSP90 family molecular chaperone
MQTTLKLKVSRSLLQGNVYFNTIKTERTEEVRKSLS